MVLKLNDTKRNPKTGKVEKTGTQSTVGNVSRGSAGGYTKGVISGQQPSGATDIRGQPIYGAPDTAPRSSNFQPIVPNPPTNPIGQNADGSYILGPAANTSTVNGPVNTPPPNNASPVGGGEPSIPSPVAPAVLPSSSTLPAGAQGAYQSPSTAPVGPLTAWFNNTPLGILMGRGVPTGNGPNPLDFLPGGSGVAGVVKSSGKIIAEQAAKEVVERGSIKAIANMEKVGSKLLTPGSVEAIAGNIPEANGVLKQAVQVAGEVPSNPKNFRLQIKAVVDGLKTTKSLLAMGGVFSMVTGKLYASKAGEQSIDDDLTAFSKSWITDRQTLIDAGYINEAYAIEAAADEVYAALEEGDYGGFFQIGNKQKGQKALNDVKQRLFDDLKKIAQEKSDLAKKQAADAKVAEAQAEVDKEVAKAEAERSQREFQRETTAQQQAFQTSEREARQAYEQSVRDAANEQRAFDDATATTASDGSSLSFGLLGTGGATEFVDRDTASKAYFNGKTYEELTPAQQRLLNLLKGKGGN